MSPLGSKLVFWVWRTLLALKLSPYTGALVAKLRAAAPYVVVELVLPGGSVMAILLWLYRRQKKDPVFATPEILALL
jgi:chromate transport protein ChrA